ncbi:carboxypeptidase-like regulatory domain-containing protein [Aquimarina sp. RZ0]|uniref:carboxypeptidase-like regulatory domain-containing protein n=1 Tax=Aquimarina sp. RZ0 TaxID=2607730 RepID=UPI00165F99B1|nr:carboxypeptidase-like regulatory domain-containing protein [Aquimarina sp. RZ0]
MYSNLFSQKTIQLEYKNTSLKTVLETLEKSCNIKFSFNSELIKNKKITIKDNDLLGNILKKIQVQTSLFFEKINNRYYIIRNKKAPHICGYLVDANNKKPISEAFIQNHTKSKTVISDTDGFFQIDVSENDTINIRFLGYNSKKIIAQELQQTDCKNIFLYEESFQLEEVLIEEYVTSGISREEVTGAININPDKLGILPRLIEPDVLQTIQFLPGVQSPTETASGIHIRGGTPDQNLVLWDGIKMYSTGHFFDLLSVFNPYITENVKLFRSSTEARYGNHIAGVIDITSKNDVPNNFGGGFGFNMTNIDAYLEVPISKNFGVIISGRRSFTDVLKTPTFESYSERSFQSIQFTQDDQQFNPETVKSKNNFYFMDLTLKAIANFSDDEKLTVSSIFTNNTLMHKLDVLNISVLDEPPFDKNQKNDLEYRNEGLSMDWSKNYNANFYLSTKAYFSHYNFDYFGTREFTQLRENDSIFISNYTIQKNRIKDLGASFHSSWKVTPSHSIHSGYEFSTTDVLYTSGFFDETPFIDNDHNITHAFYGEYRFNYNNKFYLNTGVRGNYFSIADEIFWEPRISAQFRLLKNLKSKASFERKNQVMSQVFNFLETDFNLENQIWLLSGSDATSILSSNQISSGLIYNQNDWYVDIEGYYKTTKGLTSFSNGFNDSLISIYQGEAEILGLDVLIKKRFNNYRTWVGYSLTDQTFRFPDINNGNSFPGNFDISHYLSWVHSYQQKNFEFSLGWNIRTGRPYTPATGITETEDFILIDYQGTNSKRLETYHRLDFSASYSFALSKNKQWNSQINFSLFNLYNRKNILNRTYDISLETGNTPEESIFLLETDTFSSGITPNLSFRINF